MKIIEQNEEFEHKFHLVPDNFMIPSHGIVGIDLIKRFQGIVSYFDMTLTLVKHKTIFIKIPIQTELIPGASTMQSRSESFKVFHIKSEVFPCVVEAQELEKGVVVPTTIVYEQNAWLRVLNTNEYNKNINTTKVSTSPISEFHILRTNGGDISTTNRIQKLHSKLKKKVPEFVRDKLLNLCTNFSDVSTLKAISCQ